MLSSKPKRNRQRKRADPLLALKGKVHPSRSARIKCRGGEGSYTLTSLRQADGVGGQRLSWVCGRCSLSLARFHFLGGSAKIVAENKPFEAATRCWHVNRGPARLMRGHPEERHTVLISCRIMSRGKPEMDCLVWRLTPTFQIGSDLIWSDLIFLTHIMLKGCLNSNFASHTEWISSHFPGLSHRGLENKSPKNTHRHTPLGGLRLRNFNACPSRPQLTDHSYEIPVGCRWGLQRNNNQS